MIHYGLVNELISWIQSRGPVIAPLQGRVTTWSPTVLKVVVSQTSSPRVETELVQRKPIHTELTRKGVLHSASPFVDESTIDSAGVLTKRICVPTTCYSLERAENWFICSVSYGGMLLRD